MGKTWYDNIMGIFAHIHSISLKIKRMEKKMQYADNLNYDVNLRYIVLKFCMIISIVYNASVRIIITYTVYMYRYL